MSTLLQPAWELRHNLSFTDACYVALAEQLGGAELTTDHRLAAAPTLRVPILRPAT
jgi:predicted nucleic acid-binding protein